MGECEELPLRHAAILGALHGPTELLPISSSGHTTLVPWLAGWPYERLGAEHRKAFEVALHAGTAAALLLRAPWSDPKAGARRPRVRLGFLLAATVPPVVTGYGLGGKIERRLGTPATIAAGLLCGSTAMLAGELRSAPPRRLDAAGTRDGLGLGFAQASALMPGVSRSGATIAVARLRGFSRRDADRLSWVAGLPVIVGAAALKGSRLAHSGVPRPMRASLLVGGLSAFLSTRAGSRALGPRRRAALLPACLAYRAVLAAIAIRRMRDNTSTR